MKVRATNPIRTFFSALFVCLRVAAVYAVGLLLTTALVVNVPASLNPIWQLLVIFGVPGVLAWSNERRIRRRDGRNASRLLIPDEPTTVVTPVEVSIARFADEQDDRNDLAHDTQQAPPPSAAPAEASERARTKNREGWINSTDSATVDGREIGGMVYVGVAPPVTSRGRREACRAYIDPSLPVARKVSAKSKEPPPHWPSYTRLTAQQRAVYLNWLQDGKVSETIDLGYVFLYFYGLERRFLLEDVSPSEARAILNEAQRLHVLYTGSAAVQRHVGAFIGVARMQLYPLPDTPLLMESAISDVPLRVAIGVRVGRDEPISADWLLAWFLSHPECSLRTPATRCENEFRSTFLAFFDDRFPTGLQVSNPRKNLSIIYRAASGEFESTFAPKVDGQHVADVSGLRKPIETAQEIADDAMTALDRYSRQIGRDPDAAQTLSGHLLLPATIRETFPCSERHSLENWARGRIETNGLVPVLDVIERVNGHRLDKIGKRDLVDTADILAQIGIGLAPDPRFALRRPKTGEPVVLFDLGGEVETLQSVSAAFSSALLELALGAMVAHADGEIHDKEKAHLEARMRTVDLPDETERLRLAANLAWFLEVPPDLPSLRRRMKDATPEQIETMRIALVTSAQADGEIVPKEVASLEKVYRALKLDSASVYSDLHAIGKIDSLAAARTRQGASRSELHASADKSLSSGLDLARVTAILSDTARVSSVLGSIFEESADEEFRTTPEDRQDDAIESLSGLDEGHSRLVRALLERDHWSETEFENLCRSENLMVQGALETLNEWSYELYDAALLDVYNGYDIEAGIAARIREQPEID